MRLRGRRFALILASAAPLVANVHDTPEAAVATETLDVSSAAEEVPPAMIHEDENDSFDSVYTALEAIHDEGALRLPSLSGSDSVDATETSEENPSAPSTQGPDDTSSSEPLQEENKPPDKELTNDEDEENDSSGNNMSISAEKENGNEIAEDVEVDGDADETVAVDSEETNELPEEEDDKSEEGSEEVVEPTETTEQDSSGKRPDGFEEDEDEEDSLLRLSVDYASKSAGALIIEKSSGFKGTSNLLNGDKDKYAIAPCEDRKFVVVSLSEDILVKQIKLANYERFSSSVKDFQVMGGQILGNWFDLGTYSARTGNGEQVFDLEEPAWARFLKFKFLSHHGVEYYCTYSQIKVHGSTMVQGFHEQWEESQEEEEENEEESDELLNDEETVDGTVKESVDHGDVVEEPENQDEDSIKSGDDESIDSSHSDHTSASPEGQQQEDDREEAARGSLDESTLHQKHNNSNGSNIAAMVSSNDLHHKLNGDMTDPELFSNLYDLIPSTLNALPAGSRNLRDRQKAMSISKEDPESFSHLGPLAVQSVVQQMSYSSMRSRVPETQGDATVAPSVRSNVGESILEYLGTELGRMVSSGRREKDDEQKPELMAGRGDSEINSPPIPQDEIVTEAVDTEVDADLKLDDIETIHSTANTTESDMEAVEIPAQTNLSSVETHAMDLTLSAMLKNLPSSECLTELDFETFKSKILESKKPHGGGSHSTSGSNPMEPIFKKLTDEIKSLHTSLSIQDQFTRASAICYQRVLLDLVLEMETLRVDHEERLKRLERKWQGTQFSIQHAVVTFVTTFYSHLHTATIFLYSALLWGSNVLIRLLVRLPGLTYRQILHSWPSVKAVLMSNSDFVEYMRPLIDEMDQRLLDLESSGNTTMDTVDRNEMWHFPVVPIVLLILVGRLVMCFAVASPNRARSPRNSNCRPQSTTLGESNGVSTSQSQSANGSETISPPELVSESSSSQLKSSELPTPINGSKTTAPSDSESESVSPQLESQQLSTPMNGSSRASSPPELVSESPATHLESQEQKSTPKDTSLVTP